MLWGGLIPLDSLEACLFEPSSDEQQVAVHLLRYLDKSNTLATHCTRRRFTWYGNTCLMRRTWWNWGPHFLQPWCLLPAATAYAPWFIWGFNYSFTNYILLTTYTIVIVFFVLFVYQQNNGFHPSGNICSSNQHHLFVFELIVGDQIPIWIVSTPKVRNSQGDELLSEARARMPSSSEATQRPGTTCLTLLV